MWWIIRFCLIVYWIEANTIRDGYEHDTIPDNNHRQIVEEKEMWLDDFTNDKVDHLNICGILWI